MVQIGFSTQWCNLILQCISTTNLVVLVNGSPGKFCKPSRGLIQGDPLSSYLFLLCTEALSRYLIHAESQSLIHGIILCSDAPSISHLLFSDDCMIFCKANMKECHNLIKIFQDFSQTSRKMINFAKSGIFFSKYNAPDIDDGQCVRARNYKDSTVGLSRADRAGRGAHLALEWGKEIQKSNIDAEDDATL
ncbi:uncharacterized protein LOC113291867 [Papaver somniferum]|uniref:uncharacterized protein LOC113291867 n=1 Tax=Papaver somniferum TaxID=3469 RepID=UPI000E702B63|nr:uncharacterized protein LOC113291867 [Papaver somniferum]